jgi:hypothetical protein
VCYLFEVLGAGISLTIETLCGSLSLQALLMTLVSAKPAVCHFSPFLFSQSQYSRDFALPFDKGGSVGHCRVVIAIRDLVLCLMPCSRGLSFRVQSWDAFHFSSEGSTHQSPLRHK